MQVLVAGEGGYSKDLHEASVINLCKDDAYRHHKGYEEVKVPAAKKSTPEPGERVVLIEDMEEWAQLAFSGYK